MRALGKTGFTLIEIAIVLAVIGMVMFLVIPRLPTSERDSLKISAGTLASTLRYLQDRAATSRTIYFLRMEPGTGLVRVLEAGTDGEEKTPTDPLLQKKPIKDGIVVADVVVPRFGKLIDGKVRIAIGMGGLRDFTVIHLRSADGGFWTVMAFPSNGKVKIYQGYQEEPL